jgi:hypothetical protein
MQLYAARPQRDLGLHDRSSRLSRSIVLWRSLVLEDGNSWQKSGRARLNCSSFVDFLETCNPPETWMLLPSHKADACVKMVLLASTLSSWAAFSHRLLPMTQQIL